MSNYKGIRIGLIIVVLLLILFGHIYDMPELYIPGWGIGISMVFYILTTRKQVSGTNELIYGGDCKDIAEYNKYGYVEEEWCNFNKKETDKTNLTRDANLLFSSGNVKNISCAQEADKAYANLNNDCEIIIQRKKQEKKKTTTNSNNESSWFNWFTSYNNESDYETYYTPQYSYTKPTTDYKNMTYINLRDKVYVADQNAYKEMGNKVFAQRFAESVSQQQRETDNEFCTIM
jgi:hypothetical protein